MPLSSTTTPRAVADRFWTHRRIVVAAVLLLLMSAAMELALCFSLATAKVHWFGTFTTSVRGTAGSVNCDLLMYRQFGVRAYAASIWNPSGVGQLGRDEFVRAIPDAQGLALPSTFDNAEIYNSLAVGFPFRCARGWLCRPRLLPGQGTTPSPITRHGLHNTLVGSQRYEIPYHIAPIPFTLNVLIIALSLFSIGFVVELGRTRFVQARRKPGHCTACGYDLHGITTPCPECGGDQSAASG